MNHKGFTFVEILVVISIIGLLTVISVPAINSASYKAKKKACNVKITEAEKSALLWARDNAKCIVSPETSDCVKNTNGADSSSDICVYNNETKKATCAIKMDTLAKLNYIPYDSNVGQVLNPINDDNLNNHMIEFVFDRETLKSTILNKDDKYTMCLLDVPENSGGIIPTSGNEPDGDEPGGNEPGSEDPVIIEEPPIPELKTWNNTASGDGSLLGAIKRDNYVLLYDYLPSLPAFSASEANESELSSVEDDDGESYFFRGAGNLVNNWVKFGKDASNGDIYWRIIRVNGDGSIRLIYNGPNTNQTGASTQIQTSAFNTNDNDIKYVGYTYLVTANNLNTETNSTIKTNLETWYNDNFGASSRNASLAEYIVNSSFCNDKSYGSGSGNAIYYGPNYRVQITKKPSYKCPTAISENIAATTTRNKYTLKVGLITADEVAFAGAGSGTGAKTYWLNTNQDYWTISPCWNFDGPFYIRWTGDFGSSSVTRNNGIRPVINLSAYALVSGGNGSASNPYVVML